jgi:hypothetical protein
MISDLSRRFIISVCANGTCHIHDKSNEKPVRGTLPVFSTNTKEEAESLRVYHCRLARDGSGLYSLNERPRDVSDLAGVSDMLRASYAKRTAATAIGQRQEEVKSGRAAKEANAPR